MERSCEGREGWARNWTADDRLKPVTGVLNSLRSYGDWPSACHPLLTLAEIFFKTVGAVLQRPRWIWQRSFTKLSMTYNRCRALLVIASRRRWRLPCAPSVHLWSHGHSLRSLLATKKQKTPGPFGTGVLCLLGAWQ